MAFMTSGRISDTGLASGVSRVVTATPVSPIAATSASRTVSTGTPGKIRQLTMAFAFCGKAFSACPPSSIVATQVVRVVPTNSGDFDSVSAAAASAGSAANRRNASPTSPGWACPTAPRYARVRSLAITGKRYASTLSIARASW